MERINFSYSLKNIAVPSQKSYQLQLIDKIECVIKRMCWKAHFFQNDANNTSNRMVKEICGFKSKQHPGQCKEIETFEKNLYNIVSSLKYRKSTDDFQEQMKEDIESINSSPDVFIFVDKTNNIYKAPPKQYNKLRKKNVTKIYKKSTERLKKSINLEAKNIAKKLDLAERVECLVKNPAFITLKDHKENFQASLPCRLINPSKSVLGKVSKVKLEKIDQVLIKNLDVNQWKNSSSVI